MHFLLFEATSRFSFASLEHLLRRVHSLVVFLFIVDEQVLVAANHLYHAFLAQLG